MAMSEFSIRINTLKIQIQDCKNQLRQEKINFRELSWCDHSFIITHDKKGFFNSKFVTNGWCYVQNLSSLLPALILDPQSNETILDLCAAPGGKTMHLSALMNNNGTVIANDVSRPRLYKAQALFDQYGVSNVETKLSKGEFLWKEYENFFDRALVDVPCSMGQEYANKNLKRFAQRQKYLAKSAFSSLKPGGMMTYSTCTNTDKENAEVIQWLQKHCPNAIVTKPDLHSDLEQFLTDNNLIEIKPDSHPQFDPFFIALIQKQ